MNVSRRGLRGSAPAAAIRGGTSAPGAQKTGFAEPSTPDNSVAIGQLAASPSVAAPSSSPTLDRAAAAAAPTRAPPVVADDTTLTTPDKRPFHRP